MRAIDPKKLKQNIKTLQRAIHQNDDCISDFFNQIKINDMHHFIMDMVLNQKIDDLEDSSSDTTLSDNGLTVNDPLETLIIAYSIKAMFSCTIQEFKAESEVILYDNLLKNFIVEDALKSSINFLQVVDNIYQDYEGYPSAQGWWSKTALYLKRMFFSREVNQSVRANFMFAFYCAAIIVTVTYLPVFGDWIYDIVKAFSGNISDASPVPISD